MAVFKTIIGGTPSGTYPFAVLTGTLPLPAQAVEELAREGQDGQAYRLTGKKAEVSELIGMVDMANAAAARVLHQQLQDMVGSLITIHDAHGERYDRVMLRKVQPLEGKKISNAIGGTQGPGGTPSNATYLATFRFEVQYAKKPI